jgi:hypothetical protein
VSSSSFLTAVGAFSAADLSIDSEGCDDMRN